MVKRTLKLLTLAVMVFVGGNATAQITEIKTFSDLPNNMRVAHYCPGTTYSFDSYDEDGIFYVYDSNFVQHKVQINMSNIPTGDSKGFEMASIYCLSKNLFTNSGKYEFILSNFYYDEYEQKQNIHGIYNEDGELIYDLGEFLTDPYDNNYIYGRDPFIVGNKLYVNYSEEVEVGTDTIPYGGEKTIYETVYSTKVFQIAGTSNITTIPQQQIFSRLYPNPARQSVTLEYNIQGQMQEMQIVDINGRVVANYLLDPSQKQVKINTSNYKKGVYIYRYGNNSGKFVVE